MISAKMLADKSYWLSFTLTHQTMILNTNQTLQKITSWVDLNQLSTTGTVNVPTLHFKTKSVMRNDQRAAFEAVGLV